MLNTRKEKEEKKEKNKIKSKTLSLKNFEKMSSEQKDELIKLELISEINKLRNTYSGDENRILVVNLKEVGSDDYIHWYQTSGDVIPVMFFEGKALTAQYISELLGMCDLNLSFVPLAMGLSFSIDAAIKSDHINDKSTIRSISSGLKTCISRDWMSPMSYIYNTLIKYGKAGLLVNNESFTFIGALIGYALLLDSIFDWGCELKDLETVEDFAGKVVPHFNYMMDKKGFPLVYLPWFTSLLIAYKGDHIANKDIVYDNVKIIKQDFDEISFFETEYIIENDKAITDIKKVSTSDEISEAYEIRKDMINNSIQNAKGRGRVENNQYTNDNNSENSQNYNTDYSNGNDNYVSQRGYQGNNFNPNYRTRGNNGYENNNNNNYNNNGYNNNNSQGRGNNIRGRGSNPNFNNNKQDPKFYGNSRIY